MAKSAKSHLSSWQLANFAGGIDLRPGLYSKDQNLFTDLVNFNVTFGRKLKRRYPLVARSGKIDSQTQGLLFAGGTWYTVAPKGTSVVHTITPETITTLFFDIPDYTTTWSLISLLQFGAYVVAYIRHTFPGTAVTSRVFLHVFDGMTGKPTYVEDAACPTSWAPSLPAHVWGKAPAGTVGAFQDYTPVMQTGMGKLWVSRPDRNVACSGVNSPRKWNARKSDDILNNGEWYYFITPTGQGNLLKFLVSDDATQLPVDGEWAAYVLEYLDATGTWQKFQEDAVGPTVTGHYFPASVPSRFAGQPNEIQLQVYWTGAVDTILRFRLIAKPTISIITGMTSGTVKTTALTTSGGYSFLLPAVDINERFYYTLTVNGVPKLYNGGFASNWYWDWLSDNGVSRLIFNNQTAVATAGQTVFNFPIDFRLSTDEIGVTITVNGIKISAGATLSDGGSGTSTLTFGAGRALGDVIGISYSLPNGAIISLTYNNVLVSAGTVSLEGATYSYGGQSLGILAINQKYLIGVSVTPGIATASNNFIPTADLVSFPVNGYQRYFSMFFLRGATADRITLSPNQPYLYGGQQNGGLGSAWFVGKQVNAIANLAGNADASFFNTSKFNTNFAGDNSFVTALAMVQQRMIVHFASSSQLWQIDPDPTQVAQLAYHPFGTGVNSRPMPVQFYESMIIPTNSGLRGINLFGLTFNNIQDDPIGEPIQDLDLPDLTQACFWANTGQYVTAGIVNGALECIVLTYSKPSQISSWSRWTCAGITQVDALIPFQGVLYLKSGSSLYVFDTEATVFRDSNDPVPRYSNDPLAPAYQSSALWHFNDFGKPGFLKSYKAMDLVQTGASTVQFQFVPYDPSVVSISIPITDVTAGKLRIPLLMIGQAIAPQIFTTDDTGYLLEGMEIDFTYMGR